MATPQEKLAAALNALRALQEQGVAAIGAKALTRLHREALVKGGFLQPVMRGWYIPARPADMAEESTTWYAAFWPFCATYLRARFGERWCLSPEHSLSIHAGNMTVPRQLLVRSPSGSNKITPLPHNTSLFDMRATMPAQPNVEEKDGLRIFSLPAALIESAPRIFQSDPLDARAVLASIRDASVILASLLDGGHSTVAGRLAGAFRNIGRDAIANDIVATMRAAGYAVREHDPFSNTLETALPQRDISPFASRLRLMWHQMRAPIMANFPIAPGLAADTAAYLNHVRDVYVADAYNSLSIEGYRVSPELIERVRRGDWNPLRDVQDREHSDALAARGYWLAFQAVQVSLQRVLAGENPGAVAATDHGNWYREMFSPSVTAGIIRPADLAGYRNAPVYIRRSMHVPPRHHTVRDALPLFFELLAAEIDPAVRCVLGHFMFVYIHPYTDGNGRIGRFLMNLMLAGGGYPWTVVPLAKRDNYMAALEEASVRHNIVPFASLLGEHVRNAMREAPGPDG